MFMIRVCMLRAWLHQLNLAETITTFTSTIRSQPQECRSQARCLGVADWGVLIYFPACSVRLYRDGLHNGVFKYNSSDLSYPRLLPWSISIITNNRY